MLQNPIIPVKQNLKKPLFKSVYSHKRNFTPLEQKLKYLLPYTFPFKGEHLVEMLKESPASVIFVLEAFMNLSRRYPGKLFVSLRKLAKIASSIGGRLGYSEQTVYRAIWFLIEKQLLVKENRKWDENLRNQSNLYALSSVLIRKDIVSALRSYFKNIRDITAISYKFLLSKADSILGSRWSDNYNVRLYKIYVLNLLNLDNYRRVTLSKFYEDEPPDGQLFFKSDTLEVNPTRIPEKGNDGNDFRSELLDIIAHKL